MSENHQRNKRIAKNTFLLYIRTLVSVALSLYTARIVINTLGVEDYGLHHVVGGIVAMLAFLPGSMASATQRFFSHAIGQKDQQRMNQVFGNNIIIYSMIALVAFVLLATVGQWFVANRLNIPVARVEAVQTVFMISTVGFAISILQSPFMAIIVAHEDMFIYAYMSIFDALAKLGVVYLIGAITGDKIVIFSSLMFAVTILNVIIYQGICFYRYDECRLRHIRWDRQLATELVGFTWWTIFGQLTTMARTAAVTVLLNQYFTPAVIAARAIASNIANQSNMLATQFNTSLYPPIIKSYAAGKLEEMYEMVINGSKVTFFLMWLLALPLYTGMELILQLWLGTVPEYAVSFGRLTLIEGMIFAVSLPMTTAARAPGKMAAYELILGTLQFSILFVSWFMLQQGAEPYAVFYTAIVVNLIMFFVRLVIVGRLTGMVAINFLKGTMPAIIGVVSLSVAIAWSLSTWMPSNTLSAILVIALTSFINALLIYQFGVPEEMKKSLLNKIKLMVSKSIS